MKTKKLALKLTFGFLLSLAALTLVSCATNDNRGTMENEDSFIQSITNPITGPDTGAGMAPGPFQQNDAVDAAAPDIMPKPPQQSVDYDAITNRF